MPNWSYAVLIGVVIGLIFGYFVARKSIAQQPIHGGTLAKMLHYLGASLFVSTGPTVLIPAAVYHYPIGRTLLLALGMLALAAIALLAFAAVDVSAEQQAKSATTS